MLIDKLKEKKDKILKVTICEDSEIKWRNDCKLKGALDEALKNGNSSNKVVQFDPNDKKLISEKSQEQIASVTS